MFPDLAAPAIISASTALLVLAVTKLANRRTDKANERKAEAEAGVAGLGYVQGLESRVGSLEARVGELERDLHAERAQVRSLTKLLRSTVRWSLQLRDEVIRLGGEVPPMPADVEFALTTLDPPE